MCEFLSLYRILLYHENTLEEAHPEISVTENYYLHYRDMMKTMTKLVVDENQ